MTSVARVAVDVPLPHLDRVFDYEIPQAMAAAARPGHRVRVRFSGRLVDGFIVDVADSSGHRLQPLQRVVTDYPVLTPEVLRLCRAVADRYAGSLADVLRAAIPPRHARAEKSAATAPSAEGLPEPVVAAAWTSYVGGPALLGRLASGAGEVHAVLTCAPGGGVDPAGDWPALLANIAVVAAPHRGVVIVVPDARDLRRVDAALTSALGSGRHALLTADLGPQRRYSQFLSVLSGRVRIVLGTRAAVFAPIVDPGVFVIWDDGDESLSEPHAPGWHAREVLALRAHLCGGALVAAGFTRTAETQLWLETRWAAPVTPRRDVLRRIAPRVVADDSSQDAGPARLPHRAWEAAKAALGSGPVLVQVARRGYVPALACQDCRAAARCAACGGPLALGSGGGPAPVCRWCGTTEVGRRGGAAGPQATALSWSCPSCGSGRLRAVTVGSQRTAEELGRAFPGVPVVASGGDHVVDEVGQEPALVVATPGAEPEAEGGYAAVLILDAHAHLRRTSLRAGEETARRWFAAAALARPGATAIVTADAASPAVQALVRWDPGWLAQRELAERTELGLPPAVRSAMVTGSPAAVDDAARELRSVARVVGPFPAGGRSAGPLGRSDTDPGRQAGRLGRSDADPGRQAGRLGRSDADQLRILVTAPRSSGEALAGTLHAIAATRSARKDPEPLLIAVDPLDWGGE